MKIDNLTISRLRMMDGASVSNVCSKQQPIVHLLKKQKRVAFTLNFTTTLAHHSHH
jgi:hypothetical protein